MDSNNDLAKKAYDMYIKAIKVCKKIGAITEMEYEYRPQDPLPLFEPYQKMNSLEQEKFINIAKGLSREAEGSNAYMLLEPVNRYESKYLNSIEDCIEIVKKVNINNFGILADFFHISIEEADIAKSIRSAGSLIRHVHLGDSNRLLPGYGHIDWRECLKALKETGFEGYMNIECGIPGETSIELPKTAKFLKDLI